MRQRQRRQLTLMSTLLRCCGSILMVLMWVVVDGDDGDGEEGR
jgi:hypothetical protein